MSLHNRIDLIDALFQVALIDLGAGPADSPPDSGGKCSITLVFCGHAMMGNYIYDSSETSQCLPGALLLKLSEPLYLMIAPWNLE